MNIFRKLLRLPALDDSPVPNKRPDQVVPEKLVKHLHETCMLLGVNTMHGYDLDYMRDSWDDFYENWRIANGRLLKKLREEGRL